VPGQVENATCDLGTVIASASKRGTINLTAIDAACLEVTTTEGAQALGLDVPVPPRDHEHG